MCNTGWENDSFLFIRHYINKLIYEILRRNYTIEWPFFAYLNIKRDIEKPVRCMKDNSGQDMKINCNCWNSCLFNWVKGIRWTLWRCLSWEFGWFGGKSEEWWHLLWRIRYWSKKFEGWRKMNIFVNIFARFWLRFTNNCH